MHLDLRDNGSGARPTFPVPPKVPGPQTGSATAEGASDLKGPEELAMGISVLTRPRPNRLCPWETPEPRLNLEDNRVNVIKCLCVPSSQANRDSEPK